MSDTPVSLATLITPSKTVEFDFPGYAGMKVSLCHLGRDELAKLRKLSITTTFDKKTRQPKEVLDEEKFLTAYCEKIIKGWSGLKYRYLEELLLVDVSAFDPEDELPYTAENAELLMKNSTVFDSWVVETVGELENFTQSK